MSDTQRLFSRESLETLCRHCAQPRRAHKGMRYEGKCPGSQWGDGKRFWPEARTKESRRRVGTRSQLPGGGPWRVLEDCPSRIHNSQRSAEAREGERCICPRATYIWETRKVTHRERKKALNRTLLLPHQTAVPMPDLAAGACRRPWNIEKHEAGFSQMVSVPMERKREEARKVCQGCPVLQKCREYVLAAEEPKGSWGGIWGGLDPWNRNGKRIVIRNDMAEVIDL